MSDFAVEPLPRAVTEEIKIDSDDDDCSADSTTEIHKYNDESHALEAKRDTVAGEAMEEVNHSEQQRLADENKELKVLIGALRSAGAHKELTQARELATAMSCLLYTSDAADE